MLSGGPAQAQRVTNVVSTGQTPGAITTNPVTNKAYVVNQNGNSVTVIDGATDTTATVGVGADPVGIAANPITNRIYVVNSGDNTVTIIDGAANSTSVVAVGSGPVALAVNSITDKAYVANGNDNSVTVIDGDGSTATIAIGSKPGPLVLNPATNKVYVTSQTDSTVTVIDGASGGTSSISIGSRPHSIAVNPITNKIYVSDGGNITVINGADSSTTTINIGNAGAVELNPLTDKLYVAAGSNIAVVNGLTNAVTMVPAGAVVRDIAINSNVNQIYATGESFNDIIVLDGTKGTTLTLSVGAQPTSLGVNPVTDQLYATVATANTVAVVSGETNTAKTVFVGGAPEALGINPVTNKIYVANQNHPITVIDGATNATTSIPVGNGGSQERSVAVNPVTNKIYVSFSGDLLVIDGATNSTTIVPVGEAGTIALNPVTNRIYVVRQNTVAVVDGVTDAVTSIPVGLAPQDAVVNPVTNKIYVTNYDDNTVSVIDGVTNSSTAIAVGVNPWALDVNTVTNKAYIANENASTVTVIDGSNHVTNTIPVGSLPIEVAVNPLTNKVYVANFGDGTVTVIDGTSNMTRTVPAGKGVASFAIDPATNTIYAVNLEDNSVTVIDGVSNTTTTVTGIGVYGTGPIAAAANPITHKVYVVPQNGRIGVLDDQAVQPVALKTTIAPLMQNQTSLADPSFNIAALGVGTTPTHIFFQMDSPLYSWTETAQSDSLYSATVAPLQPGFHLLYAYAVDGQETSATQVGSPSTGTVTAYGFLVSGLATTTLATANPTPAIAGQAVALSAAVRSAGGVPSGVVTFSNAGVELGSATLDGTGLATLITNALPVGVNSIVVSYAGNVSFQASNSVLLETVNPATLPSIVSLSPTSGSGRAQSFSAVYSDLSGIADLSSARILINNSSSTTHACYVLYYPATSLLYLTDDAGGATLSPVTPGQATTVSNSQCTLLAAGSSVTVSGNTMTVTFSLSFADAFAGQKTVYLQAPANNGLSSGALAEGTWTVPATGLTLTAVPPFQSNPNLSQTAWLYITNNNSASVSLNPQLEGDKAYALMESCTYLAVAATCGVEISYTPVQLGTNSATLKLNASDGELPVVRLTGSSLSPAVLLNRLQLNFQTNIGASDYERLYITNNLPHTLNLLPVLPSSKFSFVNSCNAIGAFQTCGLNVAYSPTATETLSLPLNLNFQNAPATVAQTIPLNVNSAVPPPVFVSTTDIQLATVAGETISSAPVLITNNTPSTISVHPFVAGSSAFTISTTCAALIPAATCDISVHYLPLSGNIETAAVALNFGNAPVLSPANIQLHGFASAPNRVTVNGSAAPKTVTLTTNVGTFQTSLVTVLNGTSHSLNLTPVLAGDSTLQLPYPCSSIPKHQICQMTVLFKPTLVGTVEATLDVNPTNLQKGDERSVPLLHFAATAKN